MANKQFSTDDIEPVAKHISSPLDMICVAEVAPKTGPEQGSSSVLFLKRIRAYFFRVYTRTLDFRNTQGCTLPGDFAHSKIRLR